jgi:GTP-binding protein HflX
MIEREIVVPWSKQGRIGEVYESARVVSEEYGETGTKLVVRGLPAAIAKLERAFA